jgi:hypothetical protein
MKLGKLLSVGEVVEQIATEPTNAAEQPVPVADPAVERAVDSAPEQDPVVVSAEQ